MESVGMRLSFLLGLCCVSWWAISVSGAAQDQVPASDQESSSRYIINTQDHDPNGIGKFYMGREIAHVMGFPAADWLERPEREKEEQLTKLVEALKLKPGMVVADIGAGSGRISELISPIVGSQGKVLAVDIQDEMLALIREKAKQKKLTNIEPVLSTEKSPKLEPGSVDLAFMVDVYHELSHPYEMTRELSRALKPGGRLVFVEYRKEDPKVRRMIKLVHTMTVAQVKKEAEQPEFGLNWKETVKVLPVQHILIFEKQQPAAGAEM
jgi:ubiquinone/menaquinone biosynthesis C-methylase UbiE